MFQVGYPSNDYDDLQKIRQVNRFLVAFPQMFTKETAFATSCLLSYSQTYKE